VIPKKKGRIIRGTRGHPASLDASTGASKTAAGRCPKCGGQMINGICTKCKFSEKTAYESREQAKEFTHPG
jgi:hypothetical protein